MIEAWVFAWGSAAGSRVLPWCPHVNTPSIGRHSEIARKSFGYELVRVQKPSPGRIRQPSVGDCATDRQRARPRSGLRTWADALTLVPAVATSQARFQRQRSSSPSA